MSYPYWRLDYEMIPNTQRVHVIVSHTDGTRIGCGVASRNFWPMGTEFPLGDRATASIMMTTPEQCDHGGTHREPVNVWTGKAVPT